MNAPVLFCFSFLAGGNLLAESGKIVLFNGTSSAGKSSLAEIVVRDSETKFEVVSFDDFHRSYREKHGITRFNQEYIKAFEIDKDREVVVVAKGKYDLVLDTRARSKKENVRILEDYIRGRR
jgi:chloramphenicol 3-O-phosphotransferase